MEWRLGLSGEFFLYPTFCNVKAGVDVDHAMDSHNIVEGRGEKGKAEKWPKLTEFTTMSLTKKVALVPNRVSPISSSG